MGWIWNVILSFSNEEYWIEGKEEMLESAPALDKINAWMKAHHQHDSYTLKDLSLCASGAGMTANIFGGGFKHFDIEAFVDVVAKQEWQDRDNIQLFLQGEDEGKFDIVTFSDNEKE